MYERKSMNFSIEEENSLKHYGVLGMKWGRRKQKVSSGTRKKKTSTAKTSTVSKKVANTREKLKKTIANIDKEKVKKVAKTTAIVAGSAAAAAALGYVGLLGVNNALTIVARNGAASGAAYQNLMDRAFGDYNGPIRDVSGLWIRNNKKY